LKNGGAIKQQRFKVNGYNAEKWILISKKKFNELLSFSQTAKCAIFPYRYINFNPWVSSWKERKSKLPAFLDEFSQPEIITNQILQNETGENLNNYTCTR